MDLIVALLFQAIDIFIWIMIISIVMSWLIAFNVLSTEHKIVQQIYTILNKIVDPVLKPIRQVVPSIGGIDISPIVLIIGIQIIQQLLISLLYY